MRRALQYNASVSSALSGAAESLQLLLGHVEFFALLLLLRFALVSVPKRVHSSAIGHAQFLELKQGNRPREKRAEYLQKLKVNDTLADRITQLYAEKKLA